MDKPGGIDIPDPCTKARELASTVRPFRQPAATFSTGGRHYRATGSSYSPWSSDHTSEQSESNRAKSVFVTLQSS